MANNDKKISQLSNASSLSGSEIVPIVQGGLTVKTTTQSIANLGGGGGGSITSVNGDVGPVIVLDATEINSTITPINYIPSSASIDGNFQGIDSALSTINSSLGNKADISSLAVVATSGDYNDLSNLPTLGTAASQNSTAFATAAQGVKADSAVQYVSPPASSIDSGSPGQLAADVDYLYICIATNQWLRVPIASW